MEPQQPQGGSLHITVDTNLTQTSIIQEPIQAALSTAAALAAASSYEGNTSSTQEQFHHQQHSTKSIVALQSTSKSQGIKTASKYTPQHFFTSPATSTHPCAQQSHHLEKLTYNSAISNNMRISQNSQSIFPFVYPVSTSPTILPPNSSKNNLNSNSVFDQMNLRRGKWTQEEEAYAEFLIQEFEKGTVIDCENGCTLRSFLSKKLHCAPMRISKKYAGKSIGKHVFLSRSTVNGIGKQEGDNNSTTKLRDLEGKFYKSLFRESEAANSLMGYIPGNLGAAYSHNGTIHSGQGIPVSFFPYAHQAQLTQARQTLAWPMQATSASTSTTVTSSLHQTYFNALNQNKHAQQQNQKFQQYSGQQSMITSPPSIGSVATPTPIAPAPHQRDRTMQSLNSRNTVNVANLAQLVFSHTGSIALRQASSHAHSVQQPQLRPNLVAKQQIQQVNTHTHHNVDVVTTQQNSQVNSYPYPQLSSNSTRTQQAQQNIIKPSANLLRCAVANLNNSSVSRAKPIRPVQQFPVTTLTQPQQLCTVGITSQAPLHKNYTSSAASVIIENGLCQLENNNCVSLKTPLQETHDIPDFLSGFEKVAARSVADNTSSDVVPNEKLRSQYSPPFTSQSFDDFHQLLGKGISPKPLDLDNTHRGLTRYAPESIKLNRNEFSTISMNVQPVQSVSADSYAIFAQQSALAVSHHSAYSSRSAACVIPSFTPEPTEENSRAAGTNISSLTTSIVNAANLRAHSLASKNHIVSGSEKSDWGTSTEETESTGVGYNGSASDSATTSDNASDNASGDNESDSNPDSGPCKKKIKLSLESHKKQMLL